MISTNKYIRFFLYLILLSMITAACSRNEEEYDDDPCLRKIPPPSGTNYITFIKTNGDTLQHIDFVETDVQSKIIAEKFYGFTTKITLNYNAGYEYDTAYFQVEPLFNGALTCKVYLYIEDSTKSGNYKIKKLNIYFDEDYEYGYKYLNNEDVKLTITKYGHVDDKIEGSFFSSFINKNNTEDTLNVNCQFSAIRWCY